MSDFTDFMLERDDVAVAAVNNVVVVVWKKTPTAESAGLIGPLYKRVSDRSKDGIGLLVVIAEGVSVPNDKVRKLATEAMNEVRHSLRASAAVITTTGLLGATTRAVLSTMLLLAPSEGESRVFAGTDEAIEWLGGKLVPAGSAVSSFASVMKTTARQLHPTARR